MDFENTMIHTSKLTPTKEITGSRDHPMINYISQDEPLELEPKPAEIQVDIAAE